MSILVTGATGFIGSHLCRELVAGGHRVAALTRSGRTENIADLLDHQDFSLHKGEIQDTAVLARIIKDMKITTVFHLAAQLPGEEEMANPLPGFDTNARGTLNLLHAASSGRVESFIYASTMSVYAVPPGHLPVDEEQEVRPDSVYGVAKLAGELCCRIYGSRMKMIVLRYAGVYGKNCRRSDAVPTFVRQALANQPLTVHGDGGQSSDFVHVSDAVRGTVLAWEKGEPGVYNIGGGRETPIRELAERIIEITGAKSAVVTEAGRADRPFRFVLDITRARQALGYAPQPLAEGLRRYLADIKNKR
ncbi:MAG TPA: NAD-dependent epimerase/dehydratase family protein [Dehalococcoidales bacterium]|nr:NAD-dependent epimerase/dehydratase family protein [Dehalococcoidales bacterium]